jgi:hypothetical protein
MRGAEAAALHRDAARWMIGPMVRRACLVAALAAAFSATALPASARATPCTTVPVYPGDAAPQAAIAAWMATGATAVGLPGELPVMAALVESELRNVNYGDADRLGYFQMRTSVWDNGPYAGFPANPPLQLLWFTDQANVFGTRRVATGIDNADPSTWGAWVADVLQPPAQFRGRYQLRLGEAQALILVGCPPPLPPADTIPPRLILGGAVRLPSRARAVSVRARCVTEACRIEAVGVARIQGRKRGLRLGRASASAAAGQTTVLRLRLPRAARRALRQGHRLGATITVTARDAAGNPTVRRRFVRLGR